MQLEVKTLTIGLVQSAVGMDIDENLEKTSQLVHRAADSGAQIICLQELFATQYFAQVEILREFSTRRTNSWENNQLSSKPRSRSPRWVNWGFAI